MTEHEASARKKREAQETGDSGISTYATSAVAFVIVVALLPFATTRAMEKIRLLIQEAVAHAADRDPSGAVDVGRFATDLLLLTTPLLLAAVAVAAVVSGVQARGVIAFKRIFSFKIDLAQGFQSLASPARLFGIVRSLLAASAVSWLVVRGLRSHANEIAATTGRLEFVAPVAATIARSMVWDVALLGLVLALVDAVITRLQWARHLRMKDDEVRRENREDDGDPEVKHARKRAHAEMLEGDAINAVRDASVLATNPTHVACALRYKSGDDAPVLIASGEGDLAQAMKRAARAYGIPIVRNIPLARALLELPVGEAIPEELYEAVAEILTTILNESGSDLPPAAPLAEGEDPPY
jgi:flagellar biosynthesis protein FlhB